MIEAMLTTALGIAVGMASGLAATYFVFQAMSETAPIPVVDVGAAVSSLVAIYAVLLAVTLVVSSGPALRASRLAPVEALRVVD
jgi:ABC-type antimicrobial peptide transport system permease subunit